MDEITVAEVLRDISQVRDIKRYIDNGYFVGDLSDRLSDLSDRLSVYREKGAARDIVIQTFQQSVQSLTQQNPLPSSAEDEEIGVPLTARRDAVQTYAPSQYQEGSAFSIANTLNDVDAVLVAFCDDKMGIQSSNLMERAWGELSVTGALLLEYDVSFHIAYLAFSILGLWNPLFFAFHLFDLVYMNRILKAV